MLQDSASLIDEHTVWLHDDDLRTSLRHAVYGGRKSLGLARFLYKHSQPANMGRGRDLPLDHRSIRARWIDQKANARQSRNDVMSKFDQLSIQVFD